MSSRRLQLWVWWLLPFLVARALVPVGFMAQASHGQLQIVFCQSGAPQLASVLQHVVEEFQPSHTNPSSHDSSSTHWQHDVSCPFAHMAAAPVLAFHGADDLPAVADSTVVSATEPPYQAIGPPRVITNRGPPDFTRSTLGA